MRLFATLLFIIGAVLLAFFGINGQLRFLMPESRLGFFETRIATVEDEFMRRSPELRENFARFDQCVRRDDCDPRSILVERDRFLRERWDDMLPRLLISDDWGEGSLTANSHQRFLEGIQQAGGAELARRCSPIFEYRLMTATQVTTYSYQGLRCPS